jgi:hypothetical protein
MWKILYLIIALMIGLLLLVSSLPLSPTWEGFLQGVIVIVGLGLVTLCLEMNPSAFNASPPHKSGYTVYEYPPADGVEAEAAKTFQPYPDSEAVGPQLVMDHRRVRDLAEEREENLKWSLN